MLPPTPPPVSLGDTGDISSKGVYHGRPSIASILVVIEYLMIAGVFV